MCVVWYVCGVVGWLVCVRSFVSSLVWLIGCFRMILRSKRMFESQVLKRARVPGISSLDLRAGGKRSDGGRDGSREKVVSRENEERKGAGEKRRE